MSARKKIITLIKSENLHEIEMYFSSRSVINAPIKYLGDDFISPLAIAAHQGRSRVVDLLVKLGADVNMMDEYDQAPLSWATMRKESNVSCIDIILRGGADINARDDSGMTSLMVASSFDSHENVRYLVLNGADIYGLSRDGSSVLDLGAVMLSNKSIEILLSLEPVSLQPFIPDALMASLGSPERVASIETAKILMAGTDEIDRYCRNGRTALANMTDLDCARSIDILLRGGANPLTEGSDGLSAVDVALQKGRSDIVSRLNKGFSQKVNLGPQDSGHSFSM